MIMAQPRPQLFLIHEGARYHTSQAPQQFFEAHTKRSTAHRLPSYSPADHPIAYLRKTTKQRGTQNKYCKEFAALTVSVEAALAYFSTHPDEVLCLFGCYCEESKLDLYKAA